MKRAKHVRAVRGVQHLVHTANRRPLGPSFGTVRSSLMRTVPTDTKLIGSPRLIGKSPDVPVRASMRSHPVYTVLQPVKQLAERALACARRTIRREVLFGLGRTGKGSQSPIRRRTADSKERC